MPAMNEVTLCIGVLAIQGAFIEHINILNRVTRDLRGRLVRILTRDVRTAKDFEDLDGLIIPGGESTAMSITAERLGIWSVLKDWVGNRRPTWGTCAGLILLAREISNSKLGDQEILRAMHVKVDRNYYGAQSDSFTWPLRLHGSIAAYSENPFVGVFIRAPTIDKVLGNKEEIEILATLPIAARPDKAWTSEPIVAVQEGKVFLGTTFHPELTGDHIWHGHFITMVSDAKMKSNHGAQ